MDTHSFRFLLSITLNDRQSQWRSPLHAVSPRPRWSCVNDEPEARSQPFLNRGGDGEELVDGREDEVCEVFGKGVDNLSRLELGNVAALFLLGLDEVLESSLDLELSSLGGHSYRKNGGKRDERASQSRRSLSASTPFASLD